MNLPKKTESRTEPKVLTAKNIKKWVKFSFGIGTNLKILNLEPPEPRFVLQNQTSNHPKKTELRTRFVPSLMYRDPPSMLFLQHTIYYIVHIN